MKNIFILNIVNKITINKNMKEIVKLNTITQR